MIVKSSQMRKSVGRNAPFALREVGGLGKFFSMRIVALILTLFLTALAGQNSLSAQAGGELNLGDITRQADADSVVLPIAVTSGDGYILGLLQKAFGAHGAYKLAGAGETPVYTLRVEPTGEASVRLSILRGAGSSVAFTQDISAENRTAAILSAADLATAKTIATPGIFAGRLVFVSDRTGHTEVYTSDLFFQSTRQLTRDRSNCALPQLSPDGQRLLYTSYYRNGFPDIYSLNLQSSRRESFISLRGMNTGATFDPAGNRIAMTLTGTGNAEIYLSSPTGRNLRRLTSNRSIESDPAWSPDGSRLVFVSDTMGRPQLYQKSASGGQMRRVPTNISGYCAEPDWNPEDSDQIAFTAASGREFEIAVFRFSRGGSEILTRGTGDAVEPCWLPDGRHLIYTQRTSTSRRLILFDTVTRKATPLHESSFGNAFQADYALPNGWRPSD